MSALTSLLVRDGVVPVRKIEAALQKQVISGGDVETVLLEMGVIPENALTSYRAALYQMAPVSRAQMMSIDADALALVPKEIARERRLVPLVLDERVLHVALHEPLSPEVEGEIAFLLGFDLVPHMVCAPRLASALALYYQAPLAPRVERLLRKVDGRDAGDLVDVGPVPDEMLEAHRDERPRAPTPPPPKEVPPRRPSGLFVAPAIDPAPSAPQVDPDDGGPADVRALRRLRGPITLAAGERLLQRAADRDEIIEVFFAFAVQFFDYTSLFVVHDNQADGRAAHGPGAPLDEVLSLSFPLDAPSLFADARRTRTPHVRKLDRSEVDRDIAVGLRRIHAPVALVMPIAIRQRVVLVLYGDRSDESFDVGAVMELVRFGPRVVEALEQLIIRRKRAKSSPSVPSAASPRRSLRAPSSVPSESPPKVRVSTQPGRPAVAERASSVAGPPEPGAVALASVAIGPAGDAPVSDDALDRAAVEAVAESMTPTAPADDGRAAVLPAPPSMELDTVPGTEMAPVEPQAEPAPVSETPPPRTDWSSSARSSPGFQPPTSISGDSWGSVERAPQPLDDVHPAKLDRRADALDQQVGRRMPSDAPPERVLGIPRAAPPPPAARDSLLPGLEEEDDEPDLSFDDDDEPDLSFVEDDEPELSFDEDGDDDTEIRIEVDEEDAEDEDWEGDWDEEDEEDEEEDDAPSLVVVDEEPEDGPSNSGRPRLDGVYRMTDAVVDVVETKPKSQPPRPLSDRPPGASLPAPEVVRVPNQAAKKPSRPPPGMDAASRSVIVDMGEQVTAQVEDLLGASRVADQDRYIEGLLALGEVTLPVLAQSFPGPLAWTRETGGPMPRGRDLSPVARAFVAFQVRAVPYVASLLSSAHPDVRFYAILVAAELVHPDLMDVTSERIHDVDEGVREIAIQLLPSFAQMAGFDEIRTVIRRTARIRGRDLTRRHQAVDALGSLRDAPMVPKLIELLDEDDEVLIGHLRTALRRITAQDFGGAQKKWSSWYERHRQEHRVQWLIEGLLHTDEAVRRVAGEEIKRVTQAYYGYHAGSPKRDRERVVAKYREWWAERRGNG
ncbi:MAG: hypothetical protein AB8I08_24900 [Sandaracinaceae bacterium]